MQGSVAISPSPVVMENVVFRHKLGVSLTRSVLQRSTSKGNTCGSTTTARCLFGPPDPKQAKDLVREVELKNALNFGKRFNFDIVNGEPFPSAKKIKLSPNAFEDSDEENDIMHRDMSTMEEEHDKTGYVWTNSYNQDYMAMCNKHAVNTSIIGPNRHAAVSLLFAPIIHSNHSPSSFKSAKPAIPSSSPQESPKSLPTEKTESSPGIPVSVLSSPLEVIASVETNNNNVSEKRSQSSGVVEKRQNRINSNCHSHQPSAKKSSLTAAHNILTKYTNRVVKQAVMKKPRKSIITGSSLGESDKLSFTMAATATGNAHHHYLHMKRKNNSRHSGKKQ